MPKPLTFLDEVGLLGTGSILGSRVIDNDALESMITGYDADSGPFAPWVERVTHIQSRRFCNDEEDVVSMASAAAARAVEASGIDPEEVDLVIVCSFTVRELFPGDHVKIARTVNGHCGTFSLNGACAGSVYGTALALGMVKSGFARNVVVVGVEQLSLVTNFSDPLTSILFADGAGAVVVGRKRVDEGGAFIDRTVLKHDHAPGTIMMDNANLLLPDRDLGPPDRQTEGRAIARQYLRMEGGPRVLRNAVHAMAEVTVELLGYTMDDLKSGDPELRELLDQVHLVPHQANGRIVDGLQEKLGMPEERVYRTVYFAGNMSTATNLYTLDYAVREGNLARRPLEDGRGEVTPCGRPLRKGDLVVLTTIGGGYLYGAVGFRM